MFVNAFLSLPSSLEGCIVEAGCYKGGSAAKFSLAAALCGRKLVLFDSFQALPPNIEQHETSILGHSIENLFQGGNYKGTMDEVKNTIKRFGNLEVCEFVPGWFEETMASFSKKICAIYLDVDLAASTRTCLKYLYPLLVPGGILISQDGDFPLVIDVYNDDRFWKEEVGCRRPHIEGLGRNKMLKMVKALDSI
jgi:O-methyltransferase